MTDPAAAAAAASAATPRVDGIMLKFLTHKLRTHSLNEDPKADDDRDSGTESDDEFQNGGDIADELSTTMDSLEEEEEATAAAMAVENARDSAVPSDVDLGASPSSSSFGLPAQVASSSSGCSSTETPPIEQSYDFLLQLAHTDQHSSEEELEVINGPKLVEAAAQAPPQPRKLLSAAPEKRKWSEANSQQSADGDAVAAAYSAPVSRVGREPGSGSSDEEGLGYSSRSGSAISQPVQFRSSPPSDAHKPVRSLSPPPKLFHASAYSSATEPRFNPHRPRSRPRLSHSQYHSHTSLDHHHHHHHYHHHHFQPLPQPHSQQQDLADIDVISACSPRKRHRPPQRLPRPCLDFEKMQQAADRLFVLSSKQS